MPTLRIIFDILSHRSLRKVFLNQRPVPKIQCEVLKQKLLENSPITMIDVRYSKEFYKAHIPNSVNLPLNQIVENSELLLSYKETKMVFICSNGRRSAWISQILREQTGYKDKIFNLDAGLNKWKSLGYEISIITHK